MSGTEHRPPSSVSAAAYRELMSAFPTGVSVVTSTDATGEPRGMTCSSLTSVTLRPPTLLVCLRMDSATLAAVRQRGRFAVNLLHSAGRRAAEVFAAAPLPNRFDAVRWRRLASGLPWLVDDAMAVADCMVTGVTEIGDHAVVLGEVQQIDLAGAYEAPLMYGRRRFATWDDRPVGSAVRP